MTSATSNWLQSQARLLQGSNQDWQDLVQDMAGARIVLIGESSHGSHEFYEQRARLSKLLIQNHGFRAIAIEGDWPDSFTVNRYVRGGQDQLDAQEALGGFSRFPQWMWRNTSVLDFVSWLREHNLQWESPERQTGFYGLDLYSLYGSIESVIQYLECYGESAAHRARERYSCFTAFNQQSQLYGRSAAYGAIDSCRRAAQAQLHDLKRGISHYTQKASFTEMDEFLSAEQNAKTVLDAEEYYRSMFSDPGGSWNLRERHMADTLDQILVHLEQYDPNAGIIVWAHNSHVGDARATDMSSRGEWTLGRYVRERYGSQAYLIGQTTYSGSVTAATDWEMPARHRNVRPALPGSVEDLFHRSLPEDFILINHKDQKELSEPLLHRAIGVVYRPETERQSHYLYGRPARQFNAIIHLDRTRALEPLETNSQWAPEPPETYPSAV